MTRVEVPREQRGTRGNKLNSYTSDLYIPYKRHKHITKDISKREAYTVRFSRLARHFLQTYVI